MDADDIDPADMTQSFRFIRRINRWFGGIACVRRVLAGESIHWPRDRPIRWLDLGTGAADIPLSIDAWSRRKGLTIECVALDRHPASVTMARRAVEGHPRITVVSGSALELSSFADGSFDYVHAAMFLHHLTDDDVVRVLAAMGRIASRLAIWNDLLRFGPYAFAARLLTTGAAAHLRDDAILSVRKGFTPRDARSLARKAGLAPTVRLHPLVGRFVVTAPGTHATAS